MHAYPCRCSSAAGVMNVRARNCCSDLLSLQKSYKDLTRRTSVQNLRPRRVRELHLAAALFGQATVTTAVGCLPERPHYSRKEGTSVSDVGHQIPSGGDCVWEKLARVLRRLARALRLSLRALGIGFLFSPPIVSGSMVYFVHHLPGFPRGISDQLSDWWWRLLLNVVERSGPTFIKVHADPSIGWYLVLSR